MIFDTESEQHLLPLPKKGYRTLLFVLPTSIKSTSYIRRVMCRFFHMSLLLLLHNKLSLLSIKIFRVVIALCNRTQCNLTFIIVSEKKVESSLKEAKKIFLYLYMLKWLMNHMTQKKKRNEFVKFWHWCARIMDDKV